MSDKQNMEELPTGFRFYPTEEELVSFYLCHKLEGRRQDLHRVIPVISVFDNEPWDLPGTDLFTFKCKIYEYACMLGEDILTLME